MAIDLTPYNKIQCRFCKRFKKDTDKNGLYYHYLQPCCKHETFHVCKDCYGRHGDQDRHRMECSQCKTGMFYC